MRPPQENPEQSSTRAAPAVWAETADDNESTQNSTAMPALGAGATMGQRDGLYRSYTLTDYIIVCVAQELDKV